MDRGYDREFIIVDRTKLSGEEDQFKDATVFYHHPQNTMAEPEVVNKYSQLVGLATLHYHWFGNFPVYIKLLPVGCAVKQLGQKHLMMLASRTEEPQEMTIQYLNVIHDLFTFYHQSVSRILKLARKDWTQFIVHMKEIFSTIIALVCHVPFLIPTVFHSLPYLELPKKGMPLFVSASRLLRECQLNRFVIGGLIVHNKKIVCSQLPADIVKKLCMVAQVEYDARHSDLVHDMTKVFKIALEGEVVLKLHNLWVLEVFLTEQEVANIKQCRANLLERSTAKHALNDASKRLENTRSPRPYGTWRRNMTPSFRTGLVAASEKVSEHGSGLNNLTSPTWVLKRKNLEAVPSPVEGYHIEPESQKEASVEPFPEEEGNLDDAFQDDKVDGEVETTPPIEIVKQTSKTSVDSYHTPPMVTSPKHPLAVPDLEDIEDVTPEEQTSDAPSSDNAPSSGDAPLGNHISSTSTLVKSAEMATHSTLDHPDIHPPTFYSTSSNGGSSGSSSSNDEDNFSQSQLLEDSISLKTAEDSQQSHYGSVDEDKTINAVSLAEEISRLKGEDKESLVEENVVHQNGWVSMDNESDELSNRMDLNMPRTDKKQEFPIEGITKKITPELHSNCEVNHDSSNALLPDGDSPDDITSSKPVTELLDHETPVVVLHADDKAIQEANILVDSGNGEDAGVSPTLSSVSCSDGRSSCRSSNLYTPQTASSEVQDNEESDEHDTSHLIQLCAYVQCYQDTVTILLGDSELSEDVAGLEALWKKIMPPLYNIQAELKNLLNVPYTEMLTLEDCAVNAPFWGISYYDKCKRCKASPPVVSFQFRHSVRSCHLEYKSDPSLSQISLWKDQSKLVSQRVRQCEHYFYPNAGLYNHHSFLHPVTAHITMENLAKAKSKQTNKIFIM